MAKISLDGIWQFGFVEGKCADPIAVPVSSVTAVPSCFDADPELFGLRGTGVYRRMVECGGRVRLTFSGGLFVRVFWDGAEVGCSELPYTVEDYEFDAGLPGRHELAVVTDNVLSGANSEIFKEYYDFYGYGGIYSGIELEEIADETIRRIQITPLDYHTGEIEIAVEFPDTGTAVLMLAFDHGTPEKVSYSGPIRRKVPGFKLWSPDSPALHTLTVSRNGKSKDAVFGIRTIDWHGGVLRLNGEAIRLIGYCRHESHPDFGSSTPLSIVRNDLIRIKKQGCNFIRGSHYPQREDMLTLCDQLGILIWDESLGWGNRAETLADPLFQDRQEEQTIKMVRRSYNHPSVIIWGFLNECASDTEAGRTLITRLRDAVRKNDQLRPVTYASNRCMRDICLDLSDIISSNTYPGWYDPEPRVNGIERVPGALREEAEFVSQPQFADKPYIISEIGAGAFLGDHSRARWSEEYQAELLKTVIDTIFSNPRYAGLAIWQYCNCRTYISTEHYYSRPRGFNNKGVLDEYRRAKLAWHAVTEQIAKHFGLLKK